MKKSEIFYKAQLAVLDNNNLRAAEKLEILAVLIAERSHELWCEQREAAVEKAAAEAAEDKVEA